MESGSGWLGNRIANGGGAMAQTDPRATAPSPAEKSESNEPVVGVATGKHLRQSPPYLTDSLPYEELQERCKAVLQGHSGADPYLEQVLQLAWGRVLQVLEPSLHGLADITIVDDSFLEAAALSATSDLSIQVNRGYLRSAATESLNVAGNAPIRNANKS